MIQDFTRREEHYIIKTHNYYLFAQYVEFHKKDLNNH